MFSTSRSKLFSTSSLTRSIPILASLFLIHSLFILSGRSVSAIACSSSDLVSLRSPFSLGIRQQSVKWGVGNERVPQ